VKPGAALRSWKAPCRAAFYNVEVEYRGRTIRPAHVPPHRLEPRQRYLKKHGNLLAHLDAKGKVAICGQGRGYLLWIDEFSMFRQYLLDTAWMVTGGGLDLGIAPNFVDPTKLQQ